MSILTWFLASYITSQAKNGLSELPLKRQLGVSHPATWSLRRRYDCAMIQQDSTHRLIGALQLDGAYLGGERAGGKTEPNAENKVPFVSAISLNHAARPLYIKLNLVNGFRSKVIGKCAQASLVSGDLVRSHGLVCFAAVADPDFVNLPTVEVELKPRYLPEFKWVNNVRGNLKTTLAGEFSCPQVHQVR